MSDLPYYLTPNTSMQAIPTVVVESAIARIEELETLLRRERAALSGAVTALNDCRHHVDELLNGSNTDEAVHHLRSMLREDSDHE